MKDDGNAVVTFRKRGPGALGRITIRSLASQQRDLTPYRQQHNGELFAYQLAAISIAAPLLLSVLAFSVFIIKSLFEIMLMPALIGIVIWVTARLLIKYGIF